MPPLKISASVSVRECPSSLEVEHTTAAGLDSIVGNGNGSRDDAQKELKNPWSTATK